jgi:type I restriction enzyme S subunit
VFNNNLMRMRTPEGVSSVFLGYQMCSPGFRQRMEEIKKATTSVAAVYQKDMLPLAVALPPIAEQHRIVAEVDRRLSILGAVEAEVDVNLKRAVSLREATLAKAFVPNKSV